MTLFFRPSWRRLNEEVQSVEQDKLCCHHRTPLEMYRLPAVIVETFHPEHAWVCKLCNLGQNPFEVREKRRIVECPFGRVLIVPLFEWE